MPGRFRAARRRRCRATAGCTSMSASPNRSGAISSPGSTRDAIRAARREDRPAAPLPQGLRPRRRRPPAAPAGLGDRHARLHDDRAGRGDARPPAGACPTDSRYASTRDGSITFAHHHRRRRRRSRARPHRRDGRPRRVRPHPHRRCASAPRPRHRDHARARRRGRQLGIRDAMLCATPPGRALYDSARLVAAQRLHHGLARPVKLCHDDAHDHRPTPPARSPNSRFAASSSAAIITLLFTAANVYLGLKVGLTFATSIPAAVISMAILRLLQEFDHPREQHRPDDRVARRARWRRSSSCCPG